MCNNGGAYRHRRSTHRGHFAPKHSEKKKRHFCMFKVLKCSSRQLCLFCFLLYYFPAQAHAQTPNSTYHVNLTTAKPELHSSSSERENESNHSVATTTESTKTTTTVQVPEATTLDSLPGLVKCDNDACYLKISSSKEILKKMTAASEYLFNLYSTANGSRKFMDEKGFDEFIYNIGHMKDAHAGHDHDNHEGHDHHHHGDSHEGHDHDHHDDEDDGMNEYDIAALNFFFYGNSYDNYYYTEDEEVQCYTSVKELVRAYFRPVDNVQLTLGDFISLMPQILLDMQRPECGKGNDDDGDKDENDEKPKIEHNLTNIWLLSFGSVLIISLVSLLGVLMIPLLKHSRILNQLIAFLVALAVGTLAGDALLHLLPHASGTHGHTDHDHGSEKGDDHFDSMWKGLVACGGIYAFFLLETIMGFIHRRKHSHKKHSHEHKCTGESPSSSSPSKQALKVTQEGTVLTSPCESPLLTVPTSMQNGKVNDGDPDNMAQSFTPLVTLNDHACPYNARDEKPNEHRMVIEMDEEPLDTGHHHHHSHEVPKTIASLAWMVIVGDGLHNVTDGLAIGAAFTSSIGAGLSTVLAIFFHEIPQELGDFAVLLNAGMSVKQALLWNFISACMCFIGLVVGLLVGEYTSGIILWILAFTAGGFLYIALVDMLPAMMRQLGQKGYIKRFIIQNVGMLTGFTMMVVIALNEDTFASYF